MLADSPRDLVVRQTELFCQTPQSTRLFDRIQVRALQVFNEAEHELLVVAGIVMTQFDARTTLSWDVLESVRRSYPNDILQTLIPRNVRISEAPSHGKSVIEYDPTCRGAAAYRALAKELLQR